MGNCKNKRLRRLWVLYGAFFAIIMIILSLFMADILNTTDYDDLAKFKAQQRDLDLVTVRSTDLKNAGSEYDFDIPIYSFADSSIILNARVNEYDIAIATQDEDKLQSPLASLAIVLQYISMFCMALVFVFVFIILHRFYKSIKQGRVFQRKNIRWLTAIGILFIVMTLTMDFARYFECRYVIQYLKDTAVVIDGKFYIHFSRILFGLLILFVAEIFKIGYDIQKEQDLTI